MRRPQAVRCLAVQFRSIWSSSAAAACRRLPEDEGDWSYSPEWWGGNTKGRTVFRAHSNCGNGEVSVVAYPCSRPAREQWPFVEKWLQDRYAMAYPKCNTQEQFKVLGYEWRVLQFNDDTRQSTAKVMSFYKASDPASFYLMQHPTCLAVPYIKSMVSAGLTTLSALSFDLLKAASGKRRMNILCIGHGGGALPLYLATKVRGATTIHVVDIDPVVISASVDAMGFPATSMVGPPLAISQPTDARELLWSGVHDRLSLHIMDAENFIRSTTTTYDIVFIDAYDGDDIFPHKLWDADGAFMKNLNERVHPVHGTVVINLHSDYEDPVSYSATDSGAEQHFPSFEDVIAPGKYASKVGQAYKRHFELAFTIPVPWLYNVTLVACRDEVLRCRGIGGLMNRRDHVLGALMGKMKLVEAALELPFPVLEYVKRGFRLIE